MAEPYEPRTWDPNLETLSEYMKNEREEYRLWAEALIRELAEKSIDSKLYVVYGGGQYWFSSYDEAKNHYDKWKSPYLLMEHTYDPESDSLDEGEFVWIADKDKKYPYRRETDG